MKEAGLYIHIPFCKIKCHYCDFYSGGERLASWQDFKKALLTELQQRKNEYVGYKFETLYFGGGTPSLMPVEEFESLMNGIRKLTGVDDWIEFTIEVNPEDIEPKKCEAWKNQGVNRVSMGVQSFIDNELRTLGRRHTSETVKKAYKILTGYFENVSIDLMYGIPSQTLESWGLTLRETIGLRPSHISVYSLMIEGNTPFSVLLKSGKIILPSETEWLDMTHFLVKELREAGLNRYEISNFSLPGKESLHNSRYWEGNPYLGLGPSAHSYDGKRTRRMNASRLKEYVEYYDNLRKQGKVENNLHEEEKNLYEEEVLSDEELREEMVLTRLRTKKGLMLEEYEKKFGEKETNVLIQKSKSLLLRGLLQSDKKTLSLSQEGMLVSDSVILGLI